MRKIHSPMTLNKENSQTPYYVFPFFHFFVCVFSSFTLLCVIRGLCLKDFVGVGNKSSWTCSLIHPTSSSCRRQLFFLFKPSKTTLTKCFIFKKWIISHNLCSKEKILLKNNCKISLYSFSNGVCCSLCSDCPFSAPTSSSYYLLFHPLSKHADTLSSHLYHVSWLLPFPSCFHRPFLVPLKLMHFGNFCL